MCVFIYIYTRMYLYFSDEKALSESDIYHKYINCSNEKALSKFDIGTYIFYSDEKALSELDKKKRWVPLAGRAHRWLEVRNCGLTRWPDDHTHPV